MRIFSEKKRRVRRKTKKSDPIGWIPAPDIHTLLSELVPVLEMEHVDLKRIKTFRSTGSKAYARARIWAFPRIWQQALNLPPHYVIEVISEKFDHLSDDDKKRVLIHELMHIPKNFSGSLVSHRGRFHAINHRTVEKKFNDYIKNKRE